MTAAAHYEPTSEQFDRGPHAYAKHLARYISCPSKIRVRTMAEFGRAPSRDAIERMRAQHLQSHVPDGYTEAPVPYEDKDSFAHPFKVKPLPGVIEQVERERAMRDRAAKRHVRYIRAAPEATTGPAQPLVAPTPGTVVTVPEIIAAVAAHFEMTFADIIGRRRHRAYVQARQTVAYVLTQRGMSTPSCGRVLGRRDHSTIVYAIERFESCGTDKMRAVAAMYLRAGIGPE